MRERTGKGRGRKPWAEEVKHDRPASLPAHGVFWVTSLSFRYFLGNKHPLREELHERGPYCQAAGSVRQRMSRAETPSRAPDALRPFSCIYLFPPSCGPRALFDCGIELLLRSHSSHHSRIIDTHAFLVRSRVPVLAALTTVYQCAYSVRPNRKMAMAEDRRLQQTCISECWGKAC